jgi:leucine dehydrogenase
MLLDQPLEHEQIRIVRGDRTGTTIIVAVHSTALGPAIGGCRLRHYPTWRDGVDDALRRATRSAYWPRSWTSSFPPQ